MKRQIGYLVLGLAFCISAHADQPDDHSNFPAGTLVAFEGKDAVSDAPCFLFMTDRGFTGPENLPTQYYLKVQTSYSHNGDNAGEFILAPAGAGQSTMAGTSTTGSNQLALMFNGSFLDLKNAKSFNLKWKHGSHFHNSRCNNLVEHVD